MEKKLTPIFYLAVVTVTVSVLMYYALDLHEPIHYIFAITLFILTEVYVILRKKLKDKEHQKDVSQLKEEHSNHISLLYKCFPSFIDSFIIFCSESIKAIQQSKNDSRIFSIQTPLIPAEYNDGMSYFKAYIDSIVEQLLTKNININCSKISSFKRLIVINDKSDTLEIQQEKDKLQIFINSLFEKVKTIDWSADLRNIEIGVIDANNMITSPLSHIDILLVINTHLVIAFPKEKDRGYEWGTSIHFNGNNEYNDFIHKMPVFSDLFNAVWNKPEVKKINFGNYYNHENWGSSRETILTETDNLLKRI